MIIGREVSTAAAADVAIFWGYRAFYHLLHNDLLLG
jgi:hypothetical protein